MQIKRGNQIATIKPSEMMTYLRAGWSIIEDEKLFNVYKVVEGEVSKTPSKRGMEEEEALAWMDGRDYEYKLVESA